MKSHLARGAALALSFALAACQRSEPDDAWAAVVDGVSIPATELRKRVDQRVEDDPNAKREDEAAEALNRLISEQVVLNLAKKRNVDVTPAEVEARLREIHGEQWKDDDPSYRVSVRREMIVERVALQELGTRARVPESSLRAWFDQHRGEYVTPARVQIRQIVVEDKNKAAELRRKIEAGADFAQMARENSLAPEAPDGGLLPPFAKGELPEAFDRAFELSQGRVSDVIESPYGFHLFRLEARLPARDANFDEVREKISLLLSERHLDDLRREWVRNLRKNADIRVNDRLMETLR
jgi:peptidyl-prolyl cis-trans isomerase C/foldase protein PrsA